MNGGRGTTTAWDSAAYASIHGLQIELARRSLESVDWRGDERVLDVGCGDGAITARIADAVPDGSVLGVDVSPAQIAFAERRHVRPNLAFAVGDAAALGLAPAFDAVVSFNALHWVRNLEAAFVQLRRACVDGARLVVRMVGQKERRSLEHTLMDLAVAPRWRHALGAMERPFEHRPPEELMGMVRAAGFAATLDVHDVAWDFGSRDAFVAWVVGTMRPWTALLDERDREAFACEAVDTLAGAQHEVGVFRFVQCCIRGFAVKCTGSADSATEKSEL